MTEYFVLAGILLLLAVLLCSPVSVRASFDLETGLAAKVKYLFFSYRLAPQKPAKEEKEAEVREKKKEEHPEDKKSRIKDIIEQKGLSGFLNFIKSLADIAAGAAKKLFSHLVIRDISTELVIADEDAATAAILYGSACSVLYPAMSVLVANTKCKKYRVSVMPDFQSGELRLRFSAKAGIKVCFLLWAGIAALFRFVLLLIREKKNARAQLAANQK